MLYDHCLSTELQRYTFLELQTFLQSSQEITNFDKNILGGRKIYFLDLVSLLELELRVIFKLN